MTHRRRNYWKILVLVSAVGLSFPVVADAGSGGRKKSSRAATKSSRSGAVRTRRTTSRSQAASRRTKSNRRSVSRRPQSSSNRGRSSRRVTTSRTNRTNAGQASRSRKSTVRRTTPTRNVFRRPSTSVSSTSVRAPASSNRGQSRQIIPRRVTRNTSGVMTSRPSSSSRRGSRNTASPSGMRTTVISPRRSGANVVFNDSGRSRSNINHAGRNAGRSHGRGSSGIGVVTLNGSDDHQRSSVGRRGGRTFNSGHGATGAPFAGSVFINNNVSRYGRAYDRSDIFHDRQSARTLSVYPSNSSNHHGRNRNGYRRGSGHRGGHDRYRHASSNRLHFDNAFYFGSHYYGRRHHRQHYRNYDSVFYPAYRSCDYGYSSSFSYSYPLTRVGVSTQTYYEVDPAIEQVYEEVIVAPDSNNVYAQPAPPIQAAPVPSQSLAAPVVEGNVSAPQVGQIQIPQSVVDGHEAFAKHDVENARRAYLTAVLADGDDGYAKLFYAMASMAAGEYDVAALALRGALEAASELVIDPIDLRQFYNDEDQIKADLGVLVAFSSLNADDVDSQFLLAYFHYSMGQADAAQRVLMSVDAGVYEKDTAMKELRDAVGVVVSRKQDQP